LATSARVDAFLGGLRAGEPRAVQAADRLLGTMAHHPELTDGHIEVLSLISQGFSDREIAARLHLSHEAVKSRVTALRAVLGARTRAHAVALWLRQS
jgi:DNA-binding NarL/FixJ family response regulator